jgi:hypothetical protein
MNMPALIMPKNAVTASNMASILKAPAPGPNGMQQCTVKGISFDVEFYKPADVLMQQIGIDSSKARFYVRKQSLTHPFFGRNV